MIETIAGIAIVTLFAVAVLAMPKKRRRGSEGGYAGTGSGFDGDCGADGGGDCGGGD